MHPLDGPRLKVARAKSEIERLSRAQDVFWQESPYRVIRSEFNPKSGKYVYRVQTSGSPLSLDWGVDIGEVVHNLRSALDGLVYQLALLKTKTPARNTQFPIFLQGHTKKVRRGKGKDLIPHFEGMRFSDGRSMIRDLFPKHQALIERLQPYKRGRGGRNNPLYWLKEVNNADKHRLIQVVGVKRGIGPFIATWNRDVSAFVMASHPKMLKNGTKVCEAAADVHVNAEIYPLVAFWESCEPINGKGVDYILGLIAKHVSEIIESFSPEFD